MNGKFSKKAVKELTGAELLATFESLCYKVAHQNGCLTRTTDYNFTLVEKELLERLEKGCSDNG